MSFVQVRKFNNELFNNEFRVEGDCCCRHSRLAAAVAAGRAQLAMGEATVNILWAVVAVT